MAAKNLTTYDWIAINRDVERCRLEGRRVYLTSYLGDITNTVRYGGRYIGRKYVAHLWNRPDSPVVRHSSQALCPA